MSTPLLKLIPQPLRKKAFEQVSNYYEGQFKKMSADIPKYNLENKHIENAKMIANREELLKLLPKNAVIAELVGVSANTLLNYFRQFAQSGVTALEQLNFYQPSSALEPFKSAISTHFQAHPFVSINQAKAEIETLTGISLCPTQIREFLVKLGIKRRKVGQVPAKADLEKQAQFLAQELQPRLEEAEKETRQVFF